jgi:hypothetical protein
LVRSSREAGEFPDAGPTARRRLLALTGPYPMARSRS